MGKFSRNKGRRVEQDFVNLLKFKGYDARRVPLSGSMSGYKHDVIIKTESGETTFEVKARKDLYKAIYSLLDTYAPTKNLTLLMSSFTLSLTNLSDSDFICPRDFKRPEHLDFTDKVVKKAVNQLCKIDELREGADYLVIKNDRKPFIAIKYVGTNPLSVS